MFDSILCGRCLRLRVRQGREFNLLNACHSQDMHKYSREEGGKLYSKCEKFEVRGKEKIEGGELE